ncbi:MAG: thioredoxin domain-containing protein [Gammaproteobacteria bacterium]
MKVLFIFFLSFFMLHAAVAEEGIKQITVNDYLQQAKAKAREQGYKANRLIDESSPYLLQHAYNPVNWYAWGDAAFEKAKKENKPIFLSIGYSTCHWCHVMAHESFENKEIAEILNKYFVCIKVDREQRPDIDSVYMSATQLINGSGGWPMSVFLDNKLRPFHAATYYPPFSSGNRTGLKDILLKIQDLWVNQPELINQVATTVTARITAQADDTAESAVLVTNINDLTLRHIADSYDESEGGFSAAPKFPRPGIFAFLNQLVLNEAIGKDAIDKSIKGENSVAKKMLKTTLDAMASGGIYDQIAGGFHRYSVDANWQVPHFEKMLYSQALMVMAYSDFYKIETQDRYKQLVFQTLNFVKQEMQSPDGGFYTALDADSERADKPGEHSEGAYYLWRESELKDLLSTAEFSFVKKYFHIKENGNIFSDPQKEFTDLNIFYIDEEYRDTLLTQQESSWLQSASQTLNAKRRLRPRPQLDDKIITEWNGMMLSAFAKASLVFNKPAFLEEAEQTAGFIKTHLYNKKTGKLYRQYRSQKNTAAASTEATLSDYVWLIYGLLDVYKASSDKQWLNWAGELQEKQNELFLDKSSAAYFESIADDTSILFRSKSIYDGALPSANAIALSNLREFSKLTNKASKKKFLSSQAAKLVNSFATAINDNPPAAAMLLAIEVEQRKE